MYEEGNLSGATAELEEGFVVLQEILRYSYTGGKQFFFFVIVLANFHNLWLYSLVVIRSALHANGHRFDRQRNHILNGNTCVTISEM